MHKVLNKSMESTTMKSKSGSCGVVDSKVLIHIILISSYNHGKLVCTMIGCTRGISLHKGVCMEMLQVSKCLPNEKVCMEMPQASKHGCTRGISLHKGVHGNAASIKMFTQ